MEPDQSTSAGEEEFGSSREEAPQDLVLEIGQYGHSAHEALLSPLVQQETPKIPPSSEMSLEIGPQAADLRRRREEPDVLVSRLSENLPEETHTIGIGSLETSAQLAHGHGLIPQKPGNRGVAREVVRQGNAPGRFAVTHRSIMRAGPLRTRRFDHPEQKRELARAPFIPGSGCVTTPRNRRGDEMLERSDVAVGIDEGEAAFDGADGPRGPARVGVACEHRDDDVETARELVRTLVVLQGERSRLPRSWRFDMVVSLKPIRRKGYNSLMKTATISETKNQLSALLDRVRHGESILITDRSQPVARLEPVVSAGDAGPDEGRLARLERAGVIRRARHSGLEEILRVLPPAPKAGGDIVAAVLEERRSGR
ncbi:MAG: type II toxin-antitoxin system Phd/YefM family antitoxin [Thermoanaerobaculia bacterium]